MSKIRMEDIAKVAQKEQKNASKYKAMLMVCTGTGCVSAKGFSIKEK